MPTDRRIQRAAVRPGQRLSLVLVVLQQPLLAEAVRLALCPGPYVIRAALNAFEATAALARCQPQLAVLDMDEENGEILDRLWGAPTPVSRLPVIALTRRADLQTKLRAFESGVDDILTVPFSPEELGARTLAIIRRTYRDARVFAPVVRLGSLEIDLRHRRVRLGDDELELTSLEHRLLYLLAANADRLISREHILDSVWGTDYVSQSNVVDRHVCNLRIKLRHACRRSPTIATVPGRGYVLSEQPQRAPTPSTEPAEHLLANPYIV